MNKPTAVIVKGNPKFIDGNTLADNFYDEIKTFLENQGYTVSYDPGEPYTSPKEANLWIGHSRGIDRLRFAPEGTYCLRFGSSHPESINHPEDNSIGITYPSDVVPNQFHYVFTEEMKQTILDVKKNN